MKKDTTNEELFEQKVERLIKISNDNPLLPESFVPWNTKLDDHHKLMPDSLLSLYGSPFFDELTPTQKRELSRAEIAQVMYSYAWSEELACLFFFRYVSSLKNITSAKCRYVMKEIEEETRHMQMFSMAITKLGVQPLPPRRMHRFAAWLATTLLPSDVMFMSVLAIELVTDVYGDELRSQEDIFPVLAKISQLHNIEEGRHIHFAELLLKGYVEKAGIIKRSIYSIVVCLNIYFMRTMYVRKKIFKGIGVDQNRYYKPAYSGLKYKFSQHCLKRATKFVSSFNGFNWFTKLFWRSFLGTKF